MLSHLQKAIESENNAKDSVVRKLNFSSCINISDSNQSMARLYPLTTPHSPKQYPIDFEEGEINRNPHIS